MPIAPELLISSYPRQRLQLSDRYRQLYVAEYLRNRSGQTGLSAMVAGLERWMHRSVATCTPGRRILELGAGTLNHLPCERDYGLYDAVEPFAELWKDRPQRDRISTIYSDVSEIPAEMRYDQIISIAVLEHLTDLPRTVAHCALLLADSGEFRAGIPTEGGLLWGVAWRMTTGVSFRMRTGLSYSTIMRHEHVNRADEILAVVQYLFREVEVHRFPTPAKHFSFYTALCARSPYLDRCTDLVRS
jgi:hypothetical protein